jgi:CIC family chloride channel protein
MAVAPQSPVASAAPAEAPAAPWRPIGLAGLSALAILAGLMTGGAAVLFRAVVALIHNIAFFGEISFYYDPNLHTPASWFGPLVILSPVIGGMGVIWLVRTLPPDRRGQGVSDVIDAIYYRKAKVRGSSAVVKSMAAGLQSGSGGSVGREAAIIQLGAAIASRIGILTRLALWQRMTLVAAGSAAGLAAAFNTPLGAVMFVVELMMPEVSPRTFLPVTIAAGTATFVARFFYGLQPTFQVFSVPASEFRLESFLALLPFTVLGVLIGLGSWAVIKVQGLLERGFARVSDNPYVRHAVGMLAVGILIFAMQYWTGHYYVQGASYAIIQDILHGTLHGGWFLLLLCLAKVLATSVTLGSGGSGGMFSASLVIGASFAAAFGVAVKPLFPALDLHVADFAIVGMAAMLAGTTGAPLTAIVMVFEMTRDYNIIVPLIVGVTLALAVRRELTSESVYTGKLVRKGHDVPDRLQANMYLVRHAEHSMNRNFTTVDPSMPLDKLLGELRETGRTMHVLIVDGERLKGFARLDPGFKLWAGRRPGATAGDLARSDFVLARPKDTMFDVIGRISRRGGGLVVVASGTRRVPRVGDVVGLIGLEDLGTGLVESVRAFAEAPHRNPFPAIYRRRSVLPWRRRARDRRAAPPTTTTAAAAAEAKEQHDRPVAP